MEENINIRSKIYKTLPGVNLHEHGLHNRFLAGKKKKSKKLESNNTETFTGYGGNTLTRSILGNLRQEGCFFDSTLSYLKY